MFYRLAKNIKLKKKKKQGFSIATQIEPRLKKRRGKTKLILLPWAKAYTQKMA